MTFEKYKYQGFLPILFFNTKPMKNGCKNMCHILLFTRLFSLFFNRETRDISLDLKSSLVNQVEKC